MAGDGGGPHLHRLLGQALPEGCDFTIVHLSTPPHPVSSIYSRLPGQHEDETYGENHFLMVFIVQNSRALLVFAIEVLIYTTKHMTTLFISKADSTGCLHLLNLPKDVPSPLRIVCTTFLSFLISARSRPDRKLVLSLFARAQDTYLFPGSYENSHKHVLDDKGLIKWWCKVIDPLLDAREKDGVESDQKLLGSAYLRIPGLEKYETRMYWPRSEGRPSDHARRWTVGDPLKELARTPGVPERCIIPRFPDDPKARFLTELDGELQESEVNKEPLVGSDGKVLPPQEGAGRWTSIKSLEEFWDMMSYRQETAAGHIVGFIWAVFEPRELMVTDGNAEKETTYTRSTSPVDNRFRDGNADPTPRPPGPLPTSFAVRSPSESSQADSWRGSSEPCEPQQPIPELPEQTDHYFWPRWSRGKAVMVPDDYQKVVDLLTAAQHTDDERSREGSQETEEAQYMSDEKTKQSSQMVLDHLMNTVPGIFTREVKGTNKTKVIASTPTVDITAPTTLASGLVRKKKRPAAAGADSAQQEPSASGLDLMPGSSSRKKAKTDSSIEDA